MSDFALLGERDKRHIYMLVAFKVALARGYAHGVKALLNAQNLCKVTPIGVGWFQANRTQQLVTNEMIRMGVSVADGEDTPLLIEAANRAIDRILERNSMMRISRGVY